MSFIVFNLLCICLFQVLFLGVHSDKECFSNGCFMPHCPKDWERYKLEKCFKLFTDKKNYTEARNTCKQHHANLASVHSDEEYEFLRSYILRDVTFEDLTSVWLGMTKVGRFWGWDDLSQLNYTKWWILDPIGNLSCSVLGTDKAYINNEHYGRMYVLKCNVEFPFMCQIYQIDQRVSNRFEKQNLLLLNKS